jgi:acetylxylan esterase
MDNAVCGDDSGHVGLSAAALAMTKAVILMGDPRHIPGLPYNVGTCQASGVSFHFSFL